MMAGSCSVSMQVLALVLSLKLYSDYLYLQLLHQDQWGVYCEVLKVSSYSIFFQILCAVQHGKKVRIALKVRNRDFGKAKHCCP